MAGSSPRLEVRDLGKGGYGIGVVGAKGTINMQSGQLAALVELSAATIPAIRAQLDALAAGIVAEVNALHRNGTTLTRAHGDRVLQPERPDRREHGAVRRDRSFNGQHRRRAKRRRRGQRQRAGDRGAPDHRRGRTFNGATIGQAYQEIITSIGVMGREAVRHHEAQDVIANNADAMRKSVSGVSIDEEMTNLITQQNAFAAAARLVSVADQMMQDVIEMVR